MSTSHALIELVEKITTLDNKYAIGIFVDLKKAFEVNLFTMKIVTQKYSKYVVVCHKDLF